MLRRGNKKGKLGIEYCTTQNRSCLQEKKGRRWGKSIKQVPEDLPAHGLSICMMVTWKLTLCTSFYVYFISQQKILKEWLSLQKSDSCDSIDSTDEILSLHTTSVFGHLWAIPQSKHIDITEKMAKWSLFPDMIVYWKNERIK